MLERRDAPVAMLDWMMPGMEGIQVCQKLRESKVRPYVYVLLLTWRVVPTSDAMGALGLSERIRRAIAEQPIAADSVPIAITASFGVAASTEAQPLDPQEMLRLADDALYRAKDAGAQKIGRVRQKFCVGRTVDALR